MNKCIPLLLFLIFLLLGTSLPGMESLFLKENLQQAKQGDYFVSSQGKNIILLSVRSKNQETLVLEEITVPSSKSPLKSKKWQEWVDQGAPHHSSWQIFAINISTGEIDRIYSVSEKAWMQLTEGENILGTLLQLKLQPTPKQKRKKVGTPPLPGDIDRRADWSPVLSYNGEKIADTEFISWECFWPSDGSKLSGKHILVYLPKQPSDLPSYFPYWVQVAGMSGKAKLRVVDTGDSLSSTSSIPSVFVLDAGNLIKVNYPL